MLLSKARERDVVSNNVSENTVAAVTLNLRQNITLRLICRQLDRVCRDGELRGTGMAKINGEAVPSSRAALPHYVLEHARRP